MKVLVFALACVLAGTAQARGAGRAFPVQSENYVIDAFQKINRNIEWDPTNYLVDLSGQYANCKSLNIDGFITINEQTTKGGRIGGYVSSVYGDQAHVDAVNSYVTDVIDKWTRSRGAVYQQIQRADYFGCSVRPACSGRAVVACLFSPEYQSVPAPPPPADEPSDLDGGQRALAFTREQYNVAEKTVGEVWDRDHLLENLSGYETRCTMLGAADNRWDWTYSTIEAGKRGLNVVGHFDVARNKGETEPAMVEALHKLKLKGVKVGCSIIPDCMVGNEMWVVVGCLEQV